MELDTTSLLSPLEVKSELILKLMILMMSLTLMGKPVMMKKDCMTIEGSVDELQEFKRIVVKRMPSLGGMSAAKSNRMKIIWYSENIFEFLNK